MKLVLMQPPVEVVPQRRAAEEADVAAAVEKSAQLHAHAVAAIWRGETETARALFRSAAAMGLGAAALKEAIR